MKRLLLLVMLLLLGGALLNVTDIYATTENSQTPDNTINITIALNNTTELENNLNIQNSAGNAVNESANPVSDSVTNNLQIIENTSNSSVNNGLNNSISNITNVQNSTDAAGDDKYQNVRGIWLKAEDVGILNLDEIEKAGITDIFIKSNLINTPTYQNVLTALLNKLKDTDIRIHAWITCFKDSDGNWVDPTNTTQRAFLLGEINDIVRNYNIDGIHLDYVRYSGVGNNAAYNHPNATATITSFVKDVYNLVKSINSKAAVSAALMPEGTTNAYYYGQDYSQLADYLDFLVPMIYKGNYGKDTSWIGTTTKYIVEHSKGKPVISGLQTYRSDNDMTEVPAAELKNDIQSAIDNGASGYALFRYGLIDDDFFDVQNLEPVNFSIGQINDAASRIRAYIENNHKLPNYVEIASCQVTMPQFLELLTSALLQINSGTNNPIPLMNFTAPTSPQDNIKAGNIPKMEYLKIAGDIKNYMDNTGKTPDYAYQTSLGTCLGFENLVYMYTMILDYHKTSGKMADWAGMKPWSVISNGNTDPNTLTFSINQIKDAASRVRTYVDNNHKLPSYVQISTYQINMPQFLEMLTTTLLQIKNGNTNAVTLKSFTAPTSPKDNIKAGNIYKTEYLKIANDIKNYMDSSGKTPDYAYKTSLGTCLGFQNLVYMYTMILDYHNTSGKMADWAGMKPWSTIYDPNAVNFSINQINDAASRVKSYVDNNHDLPNYVQISTYQINMSQFLELLTSALLQINSGNTNTVALKSFSAPTSPKDNIIAGNIPKAEYLKIAGDIKNYMDSSSKTPDFAYQTSLGTCLGFQNLVYMYSKTLIFQNSNDALPLYVTLSPWNENPISSDMQQYLQPTANCQSDDYRIKTLESSLTNGVSSTYDKGVKIFNWVRDNLIYSYYYNTEYGAVNTYLNKEGNCVDHSHLLIALARAAKIPARYIHGTCTFTSGNVYGHVWAQLYINGKWYDADAISSRNTFGTINNWNEDTVIMKGIYSELPF